MTLSDEDVREILRIIDEADLAELQIETEGFALHVRRGRRDATSRPAQETRAGLQAATPTPPRTPTPTVQARGDEAAAGDENPPGDALLTIPSPMLGTFYRAEAPGEKPLVEVGSQVQPETTVCIIEVMKMMNSVPAGVSGTIAEVCPANAELVEYGQPLFRVKPQ